MRRNCWTCAPFPKQDIKQVPLLPGTYGSYKVTGTRINRGIGVGLEISIEITFVGKETVTELIKKAFHRINMTIEEKVLNCKVECFYILFFIFL